MKFKGSGNVESCVQRGAKFYKLCAEQIQAYWGSSTIHRHRRFCVFAESEQKCHRVQPLRFRGGSFFSNREWRILHIEFPWHHEISGWCTSRFYFSGPMGEGSTAVLCSEESENLQDVQAVEAVQVACRPNSRW